MFLDGGRLWVQRVRGRGGGECDGMSGAVKTTEIDGCVINVWQKIKRAERVE